MVETEGLWPDAAAPGGGVARLLEVAEGFQKGVDASRRLRDEALEHARTARPRGAGCVRAKLEFAADNANWAFVAAAIEDLKAMEAARGAPVVAAGRVRMTGTLT